MADVLQFPAPPAPPAPVPREAAMPPSDALERARALDTACSFLVEAPAGSGKTGLLMQRLLKLLASPSVTDPAQVLAITFTRKATHELRERVLAQLAEAAKPDGAEPDNPFDRETRPLASAVLVRDRQLGWGLIEQPQRLNIRTIDSVSAEIARALPVLSGSGGALLPADHAEELYAEAARNTLLQLGGEDAQLTVALETVLLHRDGNLEDCAHLIAEMLAWRDQWASLIPLAAEELDDTWLDEHLLPRFDRALELAVCRALTRVSELVPPADLDRLCTLAAEMAEADGYKGQPSPILFCKGRRASPQARADDLQHWRNLLTLLVTKSFSWRRSFAVNHLHFHIVAAHKRELQEIVEDLSRIEGLHEALCTLKSLPPARYPPEQWHVAKALFRVLAHALAELQLVFTDRQRCDFTELALLARQALTQTGALDDLAQSPAMNLQHLLVDEMQDTSSSQYELIERLTERWDGSSQTLFLVGDPKQSIYRFRQARVERFLDTLERSRLGDVPLSRLNLAANFRSQRLLVEAFNDDFRHVFPSANATGKEVLYYPAAPVRPPTEVAGRAWHVAVLPSSSARAEAQRRQREYHAEEIRDLLRQWLARPLPAGRTRPWRIAVLVRTRQHLAPILRVLSDTSGGRQAIAYRALEIEPLAERQEVLDLVALTRALLHPADRTAWLALLRSPLCGLSLADLERLAGQPEQRERTIGQLLALHADTLSADARARLVPFSAILETALADRAHRSVAQWVEATWHAFGPERYLTTEAIANVHRLLGLIEELETPLGTLDLRVLGSRLERLYAAPSVHPGAVDLITIHGAKGLEWDYVVVPSLEARSRPSQNRLLTWLELDPDGDEDGSLPGILAPIQSKGTESVELVAWMRTTEAAREAAERRRLFYVASTRAREELHLFATVLQSGTGESKPPAGSLLEAAWQAFTEAVPLSAMQSAVAAMQSAARPPGNELEEVLPALAASETGLQPPTIARIPLAALTQLAVPATKPRHDSAQLFARPPGSLAARATGTVLHVFLERAAKDLAAGEHAADMLARLAGWQTRVRTLLRSTGIGYAELDRAADTVLTGLRNTLSDPLGLWLLSPHAGGTMEQALVSWRDRPRSIRLDRTFDAGPGPLLAGNTHLWIVDFKTAAQGTQSREEFLREHRASSQAQLDTYAAELAAPGRPARETVRLALYYPLLPHLDWWAPEV